MFTAAFDPKPVIRTFEAALARLSSLSEELEIHENEVSGSVRRAESQHNQNVASLVSRVDDAISSFNQLDRSLNGSDINGQESGGNVALRIGERLEELDRQRQRAQDAKFLIQCWLEASEKGNLSSLEDRRRLGGGESKIHCAHIARQLLKISHRLDPDGYEHVNGNMTNGDGRRKGKTKYPTREIIEKFLEMLEKDLLKQFDDSYRRQNFEGMRVRSSPNSVFSGRSLHLKGMRCGSARFRRRCQRDGPFRQSTPVFHRQSSTDE